MSKLQTSYVIICYEVMYRHNENEEWNKEYFSTEEGAIDFFRKVLGKYYECKLLKVEALESWWPN